MTGIIDIPPGPYNPLPLGMLGHDRFLADTGRLSMVHTSMVKADGVPHLRKPVGGG